MADHFRRRARELSRIQAEADTDREWMEEIPDPSAMERDQSLDEAWKHNLARNASVLGAIFCLHGMYVCGYTYHMPTDYPFNAEIQKDFQRQVLALWPALKGSLCQVRKPCIRPNCPACARGDKHPAFILTFTQKGRRRCMYVPAELVPFLREGLENGRKLEALLSEAGPMLLRRFRQERTKTKTKT